MCANCVHDPGPERLLALPQNSNAKAGQRGLAKHGKCGDRESSTDDSRDTLPTQCRGSTRRDSRRACVNGAAIGTHLHSLEGRQSRVHGARQEKRGNAMPAQRNANGFHCASSRPCHPTAMLAPSRGTTTGLDHVRPSVCPPLGSMLPATSRFPLLMTIWGRCPAGSC